MAGNTLTQIDQPNDQADRKSFLSKQAACSKKAQARPHKTDRM